MALQVVHRARHAVLLQVAGTGAEYAVDAAQALGDELRVGQLALAGDQHVLAFLEHVRVALGQGQLDHHVGEQCAVAGDHRHQVMLAHAHQRLHAQAAAGADVRAGGFGLGDLDVLEDPTAPLQVALAGLGQGQAPGGAVQQARLQVRLQVGDQPRYLRGGQVRAWAAEVKLPLSTTLANTRMPCNVSTITSVAKQIRKLVGFSLAPGCLYWPPSP